MKSVGGPAVDDKPNVSILLPNEEESNKAEDLPPESNKALGAESVEEAHPQLPIVSQSWIEVWSNGVAIPHAVSMLGRQPKLPRALELLSNVIWCNVANVSRRNLPVIT